MMRLVIAALALSVVSATDLFKVDTSACGVDGCEGVSIVCIVYLLSVCVFLLFFVLPDVLLIAC